MQAGYEGHADPRHSPDKLLRKFILLCRGVISKCMMDSVDVELFKASGQNRNLLKGLAIKGQQPALRFNVVVSTDESCAIAAALVRLSRIITNKHLSDCFDAERQIIHKDFAYTGKSGWDTALPT